MSEEIIFEIGEEIIEFLVEGGSPIMVTEVGGNGGGINPFVFIEMTENINQFQVGTLDGKVADSSNEAHRLKIAGIAQATVSTGFACQMQTFGELDGLSGLTPNSPVYLNGNVISNVPPTIGFSICLGEAMTTTKIFIDIQLSIKL